MTRFDLLASTAMPTRSVPESVPISRFGRRVTEAASGTEALARARFGRGTKVQARPVEIVRKSPVSAYEQIDAGFWDQTMAAVDDYLLNRYPSNADTLTEPTTSQMAGPRPMIAGVPPLCDIFPELQPPRDKPLLYLPETPISPMKYDSVRRLLAIVEETLCHSLTGKLFDQDNLYAEPLTYDAKAYRADLSRGIKSSPFSP